MAIAVAIGLLAAAVFTVARDSVFWQRYLLTVTDARGPLPASFYEPVVVLEGTQEPAPPRVSPEEEQLVPAALEAAAEYAKAHGSTALIVGRRGHIVFERYWDGGGFETLVDSGSFTPVLAALAVGIAMGERKIGLVAEPVANYVQELGADERGTITIANLLTGASGLEISDDGRWPWSARVRERLSPGLTRTCLEKPLAAQPGSRWSGPPERQPCDAQILAHVIERATGEPYARYIAHSLWRRIGAADAYLVRDDPEGAIRADCCLRARRGDWMRIAELLANDGRFQGEEVIPAGWVRQMLSAAGPHAHFGYQVWRGAPFDAHLDGASEPYAAADTYLLKGPGRMRLWFVPSLRLTILSTGTGAPDDADWDVARIPNLIIRGALDYVPKSAPEQRDLSTLVPRH